jgi:heptosyltransferase II
MTPIRVLFIRFSAIGDILLVTPLIRLFHESFPQAEIDFLIKQKVSSLLEHHPLLKNVITIPDKPSVKEIVTISKNIKNQNYDIIFDLQKHWRSYFISWLAKPGKIYRYKKYSFQRALLVYLKKNFYKNIPENIPQRYFQAFENLDLDWKTCKLELFIPRSTQVDFEKKLIDKKEEYLIAVAPGAGRKTKQWPIEYYSQLIKTIQKKFKIKFILLGSKDEIEACDEIEKYIETDVVNLCGKTSLLETAALLRNCNFLICNDSGLMHMATAFDLDIIAIFGPTVREFGFFPFSEKSEVIAHTDLNCRPCSYHGTDSCLKGHFRCMKEILPEQVYQSVTKKIPKEFYH